MHRARQHSQSRARQRRHRLACEAARLIVEGGIGDYRKATLKAAVRLGIDDEASLPNPGEVEQALREYQRLFAGPDRARALRQRREAALRAMEFFSAFSPRLVGPSLDGTADAHCPVHLHLHGDAPESLQGFLHEHGIPAESRSRRLRMDQQRSLELPVWRFEAEQLSFDLTLLPRLALRQAPLSSWDERPMPRASATQLRQILTEQDDDGDAQFD